MTGAGGQVGRALMASVPAHVQLTALARAELDIADSAAVRRVVIAAAPEVIVNAAAYTAVDRAETEVQQATAINALGPAHLAEAARELPGCRLVQLSTDYVFDGRSERPYQSQDRTAPLSVYGRSKLQGEQAVQRALPERSLIIRTAWVYAPDGRNFVLTMLRLMRERGEVRVVADQRGSPTAAASIARAIWAAVDKPSLRGILHWTDAGVTTWYEFACAIGEEATRLGLLERAPRVHPITTADYPTAATRPANSVLDLTASSAALGLAPTPWREALREVLTALLARRPSAESRP